MLFSFLTIENNSTVTITRRLCAAYGELNVMNLKHSAMAANVPRWENKQTQQWTWRAIEHDVKWNSATCTCSSQRWSSHHYWHEMRDSQMHFTRSWWGAAIVYALQQLEMGKIYVGWIPRQLMDEHWKNCLGVAFNFLTQYEKEGNDLLQRIITGDNRDPFLQVRKKIREHSLEKKRGRNTEKIQKWGFSR